MSPRLALASVCGAFVIHVVLVACSSGSGGVASAPEGTANADTPAPAAACSRWEVQPFQPQSISSSELTFTDPKGNPETVSFRTYPAIQLPAGWEPFASDLFGSVIARHCIQ